MPDQPAGPLLDNMGVVLDIDDNQHLTDVLIIGRVADFGDGKTALAIGTSTGVDWVLQRGLLEAAREVLNREVFEDDD
jgi:hypothetical protein